MATTSRSDLRSIVGSSIPKMGSSPSIPSQMNCLKYSMRHMNAATKRKIPEFSYHNRNTLLPCQLNAERYMLMPNYILWQLKLHAHEISLLPQLPLQRQISWWPGSRAAYCILAAGVYPGVQACPSIYPWIKPRRVEIDFVKTYGNLLCLVHSMCHVNGITSKRITSPMRSQQNLFQLLWYLISK